MSHYRKGLMTAAAVAAVALGASTAATTGAQAQSRDILIGGGSVTGVYYQVALQTCQIINKHAGNKYNCVGLFGDFYSFGNGFQIIFRIIGNYFSFPPGAANGDFTTFVIKNLNRIANTVTNAFQYG